VSLEEWIIPPPNTTKTIRNDAPRQATGLQEDSMTKRQWFFAVIGVVIYAIIASCGEAILTALGG
jgi:hypothetical protein